MRARLLLGAVLIVSSALAALGAPQNPLPPQGSKSQSLGVVVDGSQNPERIPDTVAISMFMSSIAIPKDADERAVKLMQAKIAPMRLSRSDAAILRGETAGLHQRLEAEKQTLSASRDAGALTQGQAAYALSNLRDTLTMDSFTRLLETLSPDGRGKLTAHIGRIKAQIKPIGRRR